MPQERPAAQNLFDLAAPARAWSPPQAEGAELAMRKGIVGRQARRLLEALVQLGPMTRGELCRATGIAEASACARLSEMECPGGSRHLGLAPADPLIRKAGRKGAPSGVHVWVYEATDAGRQALAS